MFPFLVLSNFGLREQYLLDKVESNVLPLEQEKGSIMMIIATDAPLSDRQLHRVCNRMPVGLALTGSHMGNGSGDIAIAFSTANRFGSEEIHTLKQINDNKKVEVHATGRTDAKVLHFFEPTIFL